MFVVYGNHNHTFVYVLLNLRIIHFITTEVCMYCSANSRLHEKSWVIFGALPIQPLPPKPKTHSAHELSPSLGWPSADLESATKSANSKVYLGLASQECISSSGVFLFHYGNLYILTGRFFTFPPIMLWYGESIVIVMNLMSSTQ